MKTSILFTTAALTFISSNLPAFAEDTASVDAVAELLKDETAPSILEFIVYNQNFEVGKIQIPNGTQPGSRCHYVLGIAPSGDSSEIVKTYYEQNEGNVLGTDEPTPSACGWAAVDGGGSAYPAIFGLRCDFGREVSFLLSYSSNKPGVFFSGTSETGGFAEVVKSNGDFISLSDAPNFAETCADRPNDEGGYLAVIAGGKLVVSEDAEITDGETTIGTISLDASY
ncbi:MAG: hypothetical protein CMK09_00925 [Ponticaulis sp.]|nr:hypothetical protein [Ponticaulis sp.]|tara:strand:- start:2477 stop:3154 length:678 start_codon:yes stop_codon:yes gene_type:complete